MSLSYEGLLNWLVFFPKPKDKIDFILHGTIYKQITLVWGCKLISP